MNCTNEWDPLKKVIVGIADKANIPNIDISLRTVNYADTINDSDIKTGRYPQQVIEESNEDLEIFVDFLKKENIQVLRPNPTNCNYYNYCPRDSVVVYKNKALATPMSLQSRKDEYKSFSLWLKNLTDYNDDHPNECYNKNCIGNPNVLALHNEKPIFDAANIIRANEDILYLVSNSGNKAGAILLQEWLGDSATVHIIENVYSYMHIDSTIAFLKEGLLLLNPSRIKDKSILPKPFCNWDAIYAPDPIDIGHYPGYCNSSPWINVNLFSINPNLVVLEEHQLPLKEKLKKYNIDCAMLPLRHARTLGGCFHCVTLDLERK